MLIIYISKNNLIFYHEKLYSTYTQQFIEHSHTKRNSTLEQE